MQAFPLEEGEVKGVVKVKVKVKEKERAEVARQAEPKESIYLAS